MEIRNLKTGDQVTAFYLLKAVKVGETARGSKYLDLTLGDKTGEMNAKLWDATQEHIESFKPSLLVKVQGSTETYQDKLQMKINRIRVSEEADGVSLADFIKAAPKTPIELLESIKAAAASIQDITINRIVSHCMDNKTGTFSTFPAAKGVHHNYYAGLAYHTSRMLELAEFLCKQRPFLNHDLLKAGIILHDIAKTEEYEAENGIASGFTVRGSLIGHINLAYGYIIEACLQHGIDQNSEIVSLLQHLVLSHHGQLEWGSPVKPQLPEAVALHHIDLIDAKLQAVEDALMELPVTEQWTKPLLAINNAKVLKVNRGDGQ